MSATDFSPKQKRSPSVTNVVERIGGLLTATTWPWAIVAVALPLTVMLVRTGFSYFPIGSVNQFVFLADALPKAGQLPPDAQYLYNTMVGPLLGHLLYDHITIRGWYYLYLVWVALALLVIGLMAAHAGGRRCVGVVYAAFAAASTSTVLLGWIGSYDVFTVAGMTVMALSRRWWIAIFGGLIVGANNVEMGAVAVLALGVLGWADGRKQALNAAGAIAGLAVGHGIVLWWQHSEHVSGSRLLYAQDYGLDRMWHLGVHALPGLAMTWMGAATLLVAWTWLHRVGNRWRIAAAVIIAILPGMFALDETRVSAVVVWPVIAWLVVASFKKRPRETSMAAAATLIVALLVPPIFIWEGSVHIVNWFPHLIVS